MVDQRELLCLDFAAQLSLCNFSNDDKNPYLSWGFLWGFVWVKAVVPDEFIIFLTINHGGGAGGGIRIIISHILNCDIL